MAKLELNKLKEEIQKEKENRNIVPSHLGENVGTGVSPRDEFLGGLIQSIQSGKETPASNLIKVVENKITEKEGGNAIHRVTNNNVQPQRPVQPSHNREEQMYVDLNKKSTGTLAESISNFQGNQPAGNNQPTANFNGTQYLTANPNNNAPAPANNMMPQINEGQLVENVQNVVNNYLTENLAPVFEEAIKGTIIEMYAIEQIQKVLNENRDLIKSVVVETIKEIRDKSKAK